MADETIRVEVPGPEFRMSDDEARLWDLMGKIIGAAQVHVGRDRAFSVILSRTTRELRRELGRDGAKLALRAIIDTMDEAARYDAAD